MKNSFLMFAIGAALVTSSAFAQTAAPAAPAAAAPSVTAVCKDGTPFSGTTLKGACKGHGGVNKKAAGASAVQAPAAGGAAPMAAAGGMSQPAAGGGPGKVWVNTKTKVYHCPSDPYYGKTKSGSYMSEADAKSKGFRADHGKACQ